MLEPLKYVPDSDGEDILRTISEALLVTLVVDSNGIIKHISSNYAEYLHSTPEKLIGTRVEDVIPTTEVYRIMETGEPDVGVLFKLKDGRKLITNRFPVRDKNGNIKGVACVSAVNTEKSAVNTLLRDMEKLRASNEMLMKQLSGRKGADDILDMIPGNSPPIRKIKNELKKIINTSIPVLITGETGTGKEVFADAIHASSIRKNAPYVKVNCSAIPSEIIESELFGYVPGTFTGALRTGKPGKFELANTGTILLDEIEDLPLPMQSKILRVLQDYAVERIGSVKPIDLDLRVICCSNKNLYEMTEQGLFREDLLYRINVMEIKIPPLRDRIEDLPILCDSMIEKYVERYKLNVRGISPEALDYLSGYYWPGNVRELDHVIARACVVTENTILKRSDFSFLDKKVKTFKDMGSHAPASPVGKLSRHRVAAEKDAVLAAIRDAAGNKAEAARLLGISRSALYYKIKQFDI